MRPLTLPPSCPSPPQKLLNLIRFHLSIFVFIFISLCGGSEKILLSFMSEGVWPMFSSKSFTVSGFIFRSLIHFSTCDWSVHRFYFVLV